jgi:hypothetical protein
MGGSIERRDIESEPHSTRRNQLGDPSAVHDEPAARIAIGAHSERLPDPERLHGGHGHLPIFENNSTPKHQSPRRAAPARFSVSLASPAFRWALAVKARSR